MRGQFLRSLLASVSVGMITAASLPTVEGVTLTGAVVSAPHDTDSNWEVLDTSPGNGGWNLWISQGGTPINGPSDSAASISIPLSPGAHTFKIYGQPTLLLPTWRFNLFFDGSSVPGISAYADLDQSLNDDPPIFVNTAFSSVGLNSTIVAPAGTLVYATDGLTVTLSGFVWSTPSLNDADVVGTYSRPASDGPDFFGHFSITVVPEPAAIGILLLGVFGLCIRRLRR